MIDSGKEIISQMESVGQDWKQAWNFNPLLTSLSKQKQKQTKK